MALGLVDYASSSDDDQDVPIAAKRRKLYPNTAPTDLPTPPKTSTSTASTTGAAPRSTKPPRKLPSLPSSFASSSQSHDNPSAHQGRRRVRPFVDGDYYAHVFVELDVSSSLRAALDAAVAEARSAVTVHSLLDPSIPPSGPAPTPPDRRLHVSLSHPLPLRRDMVRTFPQTVARALVSGPFQLSLAGAPVVYYNSAGSSERKEGQGKLSQAMREAGRGRPSAGARAFLGLRVAAGARELKTLLGRLEDVLERLHLPLYHEEPEFHASFAWALCGEPVPSDDARETGERSEMRERDGENGEGATTPFPSALVDKLAKHIDPILASHPGWTVSALCVKVAKEVTRIPLL